MKKPILGLLLVRPPFLTGNVFAQSKEAIEACKDVTPPERTLDELGCAEQAGMMPL